MPSCPRRRQCAARPSPVSVVLAFDCAVNGLGVAVMRDGVCLAHVREEGRDQAARLIPAIASTLQQADVARREVDLIAVTIGPGSFTGVRVGLAAARGLAVGLRVPLAGVATTSVLLGQAAVCDRLKVGAIDSHLGDWFCAVGQADARPFVADANGLAARLARQPCIIVGHDVSPLVSSVIAAGADATLLDAPPDAVVLGRLALEDGIDSWSERNRREGLPRPLYLRGVSITLPDGARRTVD